MNFEERKKLCAINETKETTFLPDAKTLILVRELRYGPSITVERGHK